MVKLTGRLADSRLANIPEDLLSLLNQLSVLNDGPRNKSASMILTVLKRYKHLRNEVILSKAAHLSGKEPTLPESHNILDYTIKRLAAGIGSYDGSAHLGFSVAFTLVLQNYGNVIPLDYVLAVIGKKLYNEKEDGIGKRGKSHFQLGQAMAYAAVVKSGYLQKMSTDQLTAVMEPLWSIPHDQPLLFPMVVEIISAIIERIGGDEERRKVVRDSLKNLIEGGWTDLTPDRLNLALILVKHKILTKKDCKQYWGTTKLTEIKNINKIVDMLKLSSRYHPILHPLNATLLEVFNDQELLAFWHSLLNKPYLAPAMIFLIYKLTPMVLQRCKPGQEEAILSPPLIGHVIKHLAAPDAALKKAAQSMMQLVQEGSRKSQHPDLQIAIFKSLVSNRLCGYKLDTISKFRCISSFVNNMLPQSLMFVGDEAMATLTGNEGVISLPEKNSGLNHMHVWCCHVLSHTIVNFVDSPESSESAVEANEEYVQWQQKALQFCLIHSLFDVTESADALPHCVPLKKASIADVDHIPIHQELNTTLHKMIDKLVHTGRNTPKAYVSLLQSLMKFYQTAQKYSMNHPSTITCRNPLNEKEQTALKKTLKLVDKIDKSSEDSTKKKTDEYSFQLLILQLLFDILSHADDRKESMDAIEEVAQCYSKLKSDVPPSDDEPFWMDVLVEILISLMSRSRHILRNTARIVFYQLIHHVQVSTLQQIVRVFSSDEDELDGGSDSDEDTGEEGEEEGTVNGHADADDGTSDNSEEDSEDEEEDGDDMMDLGTGGVDPIFKMKLAKALQLDQANDEADADEDLSDSDMFKMDEGISEAFRSLLIKNKNSKLATAQRTEVRNFQTRCMDFLEEIATKSTDARVEAELILPLLIIIGERSKDKEMGPMVTRAGKILTKLTSRSTSKFTGDNLDSETVSQITQEILGMAPTSKYYPMDQQLAASISHLIRLERCIDQPSDTPSVVEKHIEAAVMKATEPKRLKWNMKFFKSLFSRQQNNFWGCRVHLLKTIENTETWHASRITACILLEALVSKLHRDASEEVWQSYVASLEKTTAQIVEECKDVNSKVQRLMLKHFLLLLCRTHQFQPEKDWSSLLKPLKGKSAMLKRDLGKSWNKLLKVQRDPKSTSGKRKLPDSEQDAPQTGKTKRTTTE